MASEKHPRTTGSTRDPRQDRLKAALKQNLSRRKAQTRARAEETCDNGTAIPPSSAEKDR